MLGRRCEVLSVAGRIGKSPVFSYAGFYQRLEAAGVCSPVGDAAVRTILHGRFAHFLLGEDEVARRQRVRRGLKPV
jgi:isoaspartyl peptidase/L-asparaginase-like protein (Ntn-hydrolase superfamily)